MKGFRTRCGALLATLLLTFALVLSPGAAQAGTVDTLAKILDVVHQFDASFPSGGDLKNAMGFIDCLSNSTLEASACVAQNANDMTDNPYLSAVLDLYVAVSSNDFWAVVGVIGGIVGDEAPCIIADIMMPSLGGTLCELFKELLALAGQVVGAIAEFLADVGTAIWDGLKSAYCGIFGCDDDGPPPPAPEQIAYDGYFRPFLGVGLQSIKNTDAKFADMCFAASYGTYRFDHLVQCLQNAAKGHNLPDNAIWVASQLYQKQVAANWTTEVVQTDIPAYGKKRLSYEQNLEQTLQPLVSAMAQKAKTDYLSVAQMSPSATLMEDCTKAFAPFAHIDKWIASHPAEAATMQVTTVQSYCTAIAASEKYKQLFAELIGSYVGQKICPFAVNKYRCQSSDDYLSCLGLEGSIGQKDRCAITPEAAKQAAGRINDHFKSQGSKVPCSVATDGLRYSEKPADLVCTRPSQGYFCESKAKEFFSQVPVKLVNCVVSETAAYAALKARVSEAVQSLRARYPGVGFSSHNVDPLVTILDKNILAELKNDPKQDYGFGPPSAKKGFDTQLGYKLTIDGASTPLLVYDMASKAEGAIRNLPRENLKENLKEKLQNPGSVNPIDRLALDTAGMGTKLGGVGQPALETGGAALQPKGIAGAGPAAALAAGKAAGEALSGAGAPQQTTVMSGPLPGGGPGAVATPTASAAVALPKPMVLPLPDLAADETVVIGGRAFRWGIPAILDAGAALQRVNGACIFSVQYAVKNIGAGPSGPFAASWTNAAGPAPPERFLSPLAPGARVSQTEMVSLKPGPNVMTLEIDRSQQQKEANEVNNRVQLPLTLTGDCGGAVPRAVMPGPAPALPGTNPPAAPRPGIAAPGSVVPRPTVPQTLPPVPMTR